MNGSSRLIGPFKHGSMANPLIFIWLGQVPELLQLPVPGWLRLNRVRRRRFALIRVLGVASPTR
jgi:hypothetical protein